MKNRDSMTLIQYLKEIEKYGFSLTNFAEISDICVHSLRKYIAGKKPRKYEAIKIEKATNGLVKAKDLMH